MKQEQFISKAVLAKDVVHDPSMDKYDGVVLFPEKLEKAKLFIAKAGLPKAFKNPRTEQKQ